MLGRKAARVMGAAQKARLWQSHGREVFEHNRSELKGESIRVRWRLSGGTYGNLNEKYEKPGHAALAGPGSSHGSTALVKSAYKPFQAALIHTFDPRWAAGIGMRLITPTGGEDFASEKWRLMPIAGVRSKLPEISSGSYFEALVRYNVSVAGDPSAKTISIFSLRPC